MRSVMQPRCIVGDVRGAQESASSETNPFHKRGIFNEIESDVKNQFSISFPAYLIVPVDVGGEVDYVHLL
ncbi:hypothetical protein NPIL_624111 [Nephila pilipes]|uniref:Uncharacterized protein n=1 Tax=Nephila pilipes TaxID=299642 RepID=A0A8X6ND81_NEPPI|nr:hypothetical protein NPIL_624111 [Nephila pilipes]